MTSDAFEQRLVRGLRHIAHLLYIHSRLLVRRCGLTVPQFLVLDALVRGGEQSAGSLARSVSLSPATISGILNRLEERGLVERTRSRADRRWVLIRPTDETRRVLTPELSLLSEEYAGRLGSLNAAEREALLDAIDKVAQLIGEPTAGIAPAELICEPELVVPPFDIDPQTDPPEPVPPGPSSKQAAGRR